jgi:DNA-binding response OmpR family regulator/chromosome segregation ATPase
MPTKVLVFESDPAFAGELRTELSRLGLAAHVVDDGYAGLMAAASDKPDLILLSIELPRMNGFSVCNKLKKDPALKDVPLIIMSSESSDDTFEQHRKLRTRAEDYVHKPIAFGELLEHMRPYVELENGGAPPSTDDTGIIIDDFELTTEGGTNGATDGEAVESAKLDAEVEAFANTAFDHLLEAQLPRTESEGPKGDDRSTERKLARASIIPKSSVPPRPTVDAEVERLQTEVERQKTEMARLERELTLARADVARLQDDGQRDAAANEQVLRLQRELDDIRLKAASGQKVGGVSSREFLDLREAVNKKEKEILSLRDQITRKEKDLLDASDSALALERDKADLEDRIGALEKDVQAVRSLADSAKADKDQAAKRAEDFKTRGEKVKLELEVKLAELASIQKKHEEEMSAAVSELRETEQRSREATLAAQKGEAEAEMSAALATLDAEVRRQADERLSAVQNDADQRLSTLQRDSDERLATAQREAEERLTSLRNEMNERLTALTSSSTAEQERLKAELSQALEESANAKSRLASRETELEQSQKNAIDALRAELLASHTAELRDAEARAGEFSLELSNRTEEREVLAREVSQLKDRVGRLESDLARRQADLTETKQKLAEQTQKVETVATKWAENRASLDQAKDALAAAVAQIEEAEARGV